MVSGVESYSVEGTPADSVILALGKLVKNKVDLVISGICSTSQGTPIREGAKPLQRDVLLLEGLKSLPSLETVHFGSPPGASRLD